MITQDDINAFEDTNSCWLEPENHYATPMEMVKYFMEVTGQEGTPQLYSLLIMKEFDEWRQELLQINTKSAELKELADLVYVICGYALSKGWNLDEALYRVHVNNISRVTQPDGTIKRRGDGKIIKRDDAPKVRLEDLV